MSRQAARERTHNRRKRNKHGRTGLPKPPPGPSQEKVNESSLNFQAGWRMGQEHSVLGPGGEIDFLESLLPKRNTKDIKGLVERRLGMLNSRWRRRG